jgi:hypothetical protein
LGLYPSLRVKSIYDWTIVLKQKSN